MANALMMLRAYLGSWLPVEDDRGQGMVEYTLIIGTISLIVVAAFVTGGIETAITALSTKISGLIK